MSEEVLTTSDGQPLEVTNFRVEHGSMSDTFFITLNHEFVLYRNTVDNFYYAYASVVVDYSPIEHIEPNVLAESLDFERFESLLTEPAGLVNAPSKVNEFHFGDQDNTRSHGLDWSM